MKVKGFSAAAVEAGIRYQNRLDLGLIYSEMPAAVGAVLSGRRPSRQNDHGAAVQTHGHAGVGRKAVRLG